MGLYLKDEFGSIRKEIQEAINDFDSYEAGFGTGKRNSVKKLKIAHLTTIIKSFKTPNLVNRIVYKLFRKSKARRSFEYAGRLLEKGIKTPKPVAYLEVFNGWGLDRSYYISEFLDYELTFRELIEHPELEENQKILKAFTKFTYDLHQKGINFLDHSPGNTLIIKINGSFDFYLVDLNRMKFGPMDFNARMKNFARLTPKKEMIKTISQEYAILTGNDFETVFDKMWYYSEKFFKRYRKKKRLKKQLLGKKLF